MADTLPQAEQSVKTTVEVDAKALDNWFHEHFAHLVPEIKAQAEQAYTHLKNILGVKPVAPKVVSPAPAASGSTPPASTTSGS